MEIPTIISRSGPMRPSRTERESRGKASPMYKNTRFKDKYQAMRGRFERANAVRKALLQDLELADTKLRKIQEENDLLLDAMLANPFPSQVPNPRYHLSPLPSHPIIPSQSQNSPQEQPGHQPSSAVSSFPSSYPPGARFDRQEAHISMPSHHQNNPTVPNHFYPSPHDGKEASSHHYSSRSRGSQSDIGQRN